MGSVLRAGRSWADAKSANAYGLVDGDVVSSRWAPLLVADALSGMLD